VIQIHGASHTGSVRSRNEDSYGMTGAAASVVDGEIVSSRVRGRACLGVVADGLGGHPCGDVASRIAVETVMDAAPSADALMVAVHEANAAIVAAMDDSDGSVTMGTTLAAVAIDGDELAVVNVGDSTVFALVDGQLEQLSVDDSPRGGGPTSFVTQTLGGASELIEVIPHVHLDDVDAVQRLLLCTDGLTNLVPFDLIETALLEHAGATAVEVLIASTLAAGAPDNVTVVIADLEQ